MEVYNPATLTKHQIGYGDIDRYIYNQRGEGLASWFGNLFKVAAPLISKGIKGLTSVVKPHAKRFATDLIRTGSKRAIDKISGDITKRIVQPNRRKTKRRRRK